ncbi:MAG: ribonuclease III [Dehalococcoidia bacterium]
MRELGSLEERLGVSLRDRELLRLAFVHSSYLNENPGLLQESNERLEFLGDALLGLAVAHELYQRYPDRPEGELTALRSALVQGETLARIADSLHLGEYLLMGRGEEAGGGRERQSNLAATFEALVGAVFQDQGFEAARAFVLRVLSKELSTIGRRSVPKNPKSALQELVQGKGIASPSYRIVEVTGKDHARRFTAEVLVEGKVMGRGTGRRKSLAEQDAAQEALRAMREGT